MDSIISFIAKDFFKVVIVLAILFLALRYRARVLEIGISAIIIGGLAFLFAKIAGDFITDPRPFIETGKPPLIASAIDNGFPSDHTLLLAAVAAVITLVNWKVGAVFWALAVIVGLARVYAGVHHLFDIAGSLLLVALAAGGYLLGRMAWEKWSKRSKVKGIKVL